MIRRYQDVALRLAARLARKEDLDALDLRVLEAYFDLVSEEGSPPPPPRDQTTTTGETGVPPNGTTFAVLPWGILLCKANPPAHGDPLLAAFVIVFFAYVAVLLWRSSR